MAAAEARCARCLHAQASEYLFYQANAARAAAPAAEAAPAAPDAAPDAAPEDDSGSGSDDDEEDESELTVARIDAAVAWMRSAGIPPAAIPAVITASPAVLAYSVEARLAPLSAYLVGEVGVSGEALGAAIARRPSLLGLSVDKLRMQVDYLMSMGTEREKVIEYVLHSL